MTPCSAMLADRTARLSGSNRLRGWKGLGWTRLIGMSRLPVWAVVR